MKKISFALSLLSAAFALTNCAKEASIDVKNAEGSEFVIYATDIRTTNDGVKTKWVAGDEIGVYHAVAGTTEYVKDGKFTISAEDLEKGVFKGNVTGLKDDKEYNWYVIYPYNSYTQTPVNNKNPQDSPRNYTQVGALTETQNGVNSTAHLNGDLCPLVALGSTEGLESPELAFSNVACVYELNVKNNFGKDVKVKSVELIVTGDYQIAGTYFIDFSCENGPVSCISSGENKYTSNAVTLNVTDGALAAGETGKFNIVLSPQSFAEGTKFTKVVHFLDPDEMQWAETQEFTLSSAKPFAGGYVYPADFTIDDGAYKEIPSTLLDIYDDAAKATGDLKYNSVVPVHVVAAADKYIAFEDDEAMMVAYFDNPGDIICKVGDIIEISGTVSKYYGTVEFKNPTIVLTGKNEETSFDPDEFNKTAFDEISAAEIKPVTYYSVTGTIDASGYITLPDAAKVRIYGADSKYAGKKVNAIFISFGFNKSYVQGLLVDIALDASVKELFVTPAGNKSWAYNETDSYEIAVEVNGGEYTATYSDGLGDWLNIQHTDGEDTYVFTPKGQNTTDSSYQGTVTFTHNDDSSIKQVVTFTQNSQNAGYVAKLTYVDMNKLPEEVYNGSYKVGEITIDGNTWGFNACRSSNGDRVAIQLRNTAYILTPELGTKITGISFKSSDADKFTGTLDVYDALGACKVYTTESLSGAAEINIDLSAFKSNQYRVVPSGTFRFNEVSVNYSKEKVEGTKLVMSDFSSKEVGSSYITVSWAPVPYASCYSITLDGKTYVDVKDCEYKIEDLDKGTEYSISIVAKGNGNAYLDSDAKTVKISTAAEATPEVLYTLDTYDASAKGSNNSYTGSCDIVYNGITWNLTGNSTINPWRVGGKNITNTDRTVYTKTAYASELTEIKLTVGDKSNANVTVNSLKLVYSTNQDFSGANEISAAYNGASTISFKPASGSFPKNCYYKFVFNFTISGGNHYVPFQKVEFLGFK